MRDIPKKKLVIAIIVLGLLSILMVVAIIFAVNTHNTTNQFGRLITIQNYDQKIKNLSPDMKDSIQTSLYNIVKKNSPINFEPATVSDAIIRDGSDTQSFNKDTQS